MDLEHEHVELHRERILRLNRAYWITAASVGVVLAIIAWLTPLRWIGVPLGVLVAMAVAWFMWQRSEGWLIASCGGREVDEDAEPRLVNLIDGLCATSGVERPQLRVIETADVNLVAVGRRPDRAVLVITRGLLDGMERIELEALLANEISQVRSLDVAHVSTAATTLGLPSLLADVGGRWRAGKAIREGAGGAGARLGGVAALLAVPFAGLSRQRLDQELEPHRDFRTDMSGVRLTRYPPGMVAALERLEQGAVSSEVRATSEAGGDSGRENSDGGAVGADVGGTRAAVDAARGLEAPSASAPLWVVDPGDGRNVRPSLTARIAALREL